MLLDLERRFCEIHIPRTGGVARAQALLPWLSAHCRVDLITRHWYAWQIRDAVRPEQWNRLYRYAVLRDPREVIASDYRLTLANARILASGAGTGFTGAWAKRARALQRDPSLAHFARHEYLNKIGPGGLWARYCLSPRARFKLVCGDDMIYGGYDLGVEMIPYPRLHELWPQICERIGLRHTHPRGRDDRCPDTGPHPCPLCFLPRTNQAPGLTTFPDALGREIDRHFREDLELLGLTERLQALD